MPPFASNTAGAKPVVIKTYGFYESIGHSTSASLAENAFIQACPSMAEAPVRIVERTVRLDGAEREAYVVERAA